MVEREVVVVGAGPAGSSAAIALAQKGRDVLLLDREDFPRDKACGDAIALEAITELFDLGMEKLIQNACYHTVRTFRIVSPSGRYFQTPPKAIIRRSSFCEDQRGILTYIVPRVDFDALLHSHAVKSGAEFRRANVTGPLIEDGRVVGLRVRSNRTASNLRAKVVIAADGSTSVIGRALLPTSYHDRHRAVALRAYIDNIEVDPHQFEFYLYRGIFPGYAWIFPYGDCRANIGLGMRLDKFRREKASLKEMLDRFLQFPMVKKRLGSKPRDIAVWTLNLGSQKKLQRVYNGALLVGDAAGLTDPLSGTGIYNAIKSARIAANVVDSALEAGDLSYHALHPYEDEIARSLLPRMRRSYLYQRILFNCPRLIDALVYLGGRYPNLARTTLEKYSP